MDPWDNHISQDADAAAAFVHGSNAVVVVDDVPHHYPYRLVVVQSPGTPLPRLHPVAAP